MHFTGNISRPAAWLFFFFCEHTILQTRIELYSIFSVKPRLSICTNHQIFDIKLLEKKMTQTIVDEKPEEEVKIEDQGMFIIKRN